MRPLRIVIAGLSAFLLLGAPSIGSAQTPETAGFVLDDADLVGGILNSNALISLAINGLIDDQFTTGAFRTLLEVRDLQDPTAQNDPMVQIAVYTGVDLDGDPSDDFSGTEEFGIDPTSLDINGDPLSLFDNGSIVAGQITAGPATLDIGVGFPLDNVILSGSIASGATDFTSDTLSGAVPDALLAMVPAPPPLSGTVSDLLASLGIFPDTDLDGDMINDAYSAEFVVTGVSCVILQVIIEPTFERGDANGDGAVNVGDAIFTLSELFSAGAIGPCEDAADANDDGTKNIADAITLLAYLFSGGAAPPAPFGACGIDPTADLIPCDQSTATCP